LRFPGFEREWEKKKLGLVATNKSEKYNPANAIKCIELEHLASESGQMLGYIDGSRSGSIKNVFQQGDILFGKLRPYLRKYLQAPFEGVCSSEIWVLKGTNVSNDFLYRIIQTNKFVDLANQSSGSKMPRADWNIVERGVFSFPSTEEQNKIASFLSLIDERIQTQNKIIEELQSLKEKLGEDIFNQKIRFSGFNDKWIKTIVKEQCAINPKTEPLAREFVYVDLELVVKGELIKESVIQKADAPSRASRVLNDWDILFQCVRPYQRNNYIYRRKDERQWVASTGYAQIRTHNNPSFIYYLCNQQEFNDQVMMRCTGTSYPAISGSELAKVPISICSREEQDKIAELLSALDEKITIEKQLLVRLKTQKDYLLRNLFI
jgi:type I restriction enzyme S subunit